MKIDESQDIGWLSDYLNSLLLKKMPFKIDPAFTPGESYWFRKAIENGLLRVTECTQECTRHKTHWSVVKDHFTMSKGIMKKPRHLMSVDKKGNITLNREYIPHIAAYARLILEKGFDQERSAFSGYHGSNEIDGEFIDQDGNLFLLLEVKKDTPKTNKLIKELTSGFLEDIQNTNKKESKYILDFAPQYLWIVGPETVDMNEGVFYIEKKKIGKIFKTNLMRIDKIPMKIDK